MASHATTHFFSAPVCTLAPIYTSTSSTTLSPETDAYNANSTIHSFLAGTNSLSSPNSILRVEYDDISNVVNETAQYYHRDEVLQLLTHAPCPDVCATVHRNLYNDTIGATFFRLPDSNPTQNMNGSKNPFDSSELVALVALPSDISDILERGETSAIPTAVSNSTNNTANIPVSQRSLLSLPGITAPISPDVTNPIQPISAPAWYKLTTASLGFAQPNSSSFPHFSSSSSGIAHPLSAVLWQQTPSSTKPISGTSGSSTHKCLGLYGSAALLFDISAASDTTASSPSSAPSQAQKSSNPFDDEQVVEVPFATAISSLRQPLTSLITHGSFHPRHSEQFFLSTANSLGSYDTRTMRASTLVDLTQHPAVPFAQCSTFHVSPNNPSHVIVGHTDGSLSLWDMRKASNPLVSMHLASQAISWLEFHPTAAHIFAFGSTDTTVGLCSVESAMSPLLHQISGSCVSNSVYPAAAASAGSFAAQHGGIMGVGGNASLNRRSRTGSVSSGSVSGARHSDLLFQQKRMQEHNARLRHVTSALGTTHEIGGASALPASSQFITNDRTSVSNANMPSSKMDLSTEYVPLQHLSQQCVPPLTYSGSSAGANGGASATRLGSTNPFDPDDNVNVSSLQQQQPRESLEQLYTTDSSQFCPLHVACDATNIVLQLQPNLAQQHSGNALLSLHREHAAPIIDGTWTSHKRASWFYATLSNDNAMTMNEIVPVLERRKLNLDGDDGDDM